MLLACVISAVYAITVPDGSYVLRIYAPVETDYAYLDRDIADVSVDPSSQTVEVVGWLYIADALSSETDQRFEAWMFTGQEGQFFYSYYGVNLYVSGSTVRVKFAYPRGVNGYKEYDGFDAEFNVWYELKIVHDGSTVEFYKNGTLLGSVSDAYSDAFTVMYFGLGERDFPSAENYLAYNIYIDKVTMTVGGTTEFSESWESGLSAYDITKTADAVVETVTADTAGESDPVNPTPSFSGTIEIIPESQEAYKGEYVSFTVYVHNNSTAGGSYKIRVQNILYPSDGEPWFYYFSGGTAEVFWLDPNETRTTTLYVKVGEGDFNHLIVRFKREGTDWYVETSCSVISKGSNPQVSDPYIGPIPVIEYPYHTLLALCFSLMLAAIGHGMTKGRDPTPALFMMIMGFAIFWYMGWMPSWIFVSAIACLAILLAWKLSGVFRS